MGTEGRPGRSTGVPDASVEEDRVGGHLYRAWVRPIRVAGAEKLIRAQGDHGDAVSSDRMVLRPWPVAKIRIDSAPSP
jgi:hypothetical protein